MDNDNEKSKRFSRRDKIFYSLISIGILCCVISIANTFVSTDIVYDFEYDRGDVHVLNSGRNTFNVGEEISIVNSPHATQVSFSEVLDFIELDKTDENEYVLDVFDCAQYSEMFHDNAENHGITSGVMLVWFEDRYDGHAFNVFNTTDKGLVFVDVTREDRIVRELKIGSQILHGNSFYSNFRNVESFSVYW